MSKFHFASLTFAFLILCLLPGCEAEMGQTAEQEAGLDHGGPSAAALRPYMEQWLALRYQPLERHGEYTPRPDVSYPPEEMTVTTYGDYTVVTWRFTGPYALVLAKDGQAIWAGVQVLPMRRDGDISSLVLVEGEGKRTWGYDAMGRVGWFDLTTPLEGEVRYVYLGSSQLEVRIDPTGGFDGRPRNGVVDIDSDGTDEFVLIATNNADVLALEWWGLFVFEQKELKREDVMEGTPFTEGSWRIRPVYDVRFNDRRRSAFVSWEHTDDGKGIVVLDYMIIDKWPKAGSFPSKIGVFTRNERTGEFVFIPHEEAGEGGD